MRREKGRFMWLNMACFTKNVPPTRVPGGVVVNNSETALVLWRHTSTSSGAPGGPGQAARTQTGDGTPPERLWGRGVRVCVHIGGYVWAHVHTCVPSGRPHGVRPRADGVRLSRWIVRKSRTVSLTCHQSPLSAGGWLNVTSCMTAGKRCLGLLSDDIANLWSTIKILHGFTWYSF